MAATRLKNPRNFLFPHQTRSLLPTLGFSNGFQLWCPPVIFMIHLQTTQGLSSPNRTFPAFPTVLRDPSTPRSHQIQIPFPGTSPEQTRKYLHRLKTKSQSRQNPSGLFPDSSKTSLILLGNVGKTPGILSFRIRFPQIFPRNSKE